MRSIWMIWGVSLALTACHPTERNEKWIESQTPHLTAGLNTYTDIVPTDSAVLHNREQVLAQLAELQAIDTTGWELANVIRWGASIRAHELAVERLTAMYRNPMAYAPRPALDSAVVQCGERTDCLLVQQLLDKAAVRYAAGMTELSQGLAVEAYQSGIEGHISLYTWLDSLCQVHPEWDCLSTQRAIKDFIGLLESRKHEQHLYDEATRVMD